MSIWRQGATSRLLKIAGTLRERAFLCTFPEGLAVLILDGRAGLLAIAVSPTFVNYSATFQGTQIATTN